MHDPSALYHACSAHNCEGLVTVGTKRQQQRGCEVWLSPDEGGIVSCTNVTERGQDGSLGTYIELLSLLKILI